VQDAAREVDGMNLRYFERRTEVVRAYVRAENGCEETNHFVKPSAVELARIAEARNGRKKFDVFVKPNGQSRACASYAMARKRLLKTNRFAKPSAEPNKVRTMPRREMDERNSRLFPQSVLRLPTADPNGSPAYRFFHSPIDKTHLHTN